jgi:hypothetical protein
VISSSGQNLSIESGISAYKQRAPASRPVRSSKARCWLKLLKKKEIVMRAERPLIASVVFLATGLSLIFGYCTGSSSLDAAFPLASSALRLNIVTTGPAALGGIACTTVGLLLMVWALLAAIIGQAGLLASHDRDQVKVVPAERILE